MPSPAAAPAPAPIAAPAPPPATAPMIAPMALSPTVLLTVRIVLSGPAFDHCR